MDLRLRRPVWHMRGYAWCVAGCCAEEVVLPWKEGSNGNEHYYGEIMNETAKFIEANV